MRTEDGIRVMEEIQDLNTKEISKGFVFIYEQKGDEIPYSVHVAFDRCVGQIFRLDDAITLAKALQNA